MSKEIQCIAATGATGTTALYARVIRATDGKVWNSNSSEFEDYSTSSLTSGYYAITMTESGTASKYYTGDFPSAIPIGLYSVLVKQKAGASCAEADTEIAAGTIEWTGTAVNNIANSDSNGRLDIIKIAGTSQTARDIGASVLLSSGTGTGQLDVTSGVVKSNIAQILGTVATAATAGILDTNAKRINNVATTSVTTINANLGVTQPINFTGTAGSAYVKSDMVDIAGSAVSTTAAQIGANVVQIDGSASAATKQKKAALVIYEGTITSSPTNVSFIDSSLTQGEDDYWNGRVIIFLTGTHQYQATNITAFDSTLFELTFAGLTSAPTIGDTYIIV